MDGTMSELRGFSMKDAAEHAQQLEAAARSSHASMIMLHAQQAPMLQGKKALNRIIRALLDEWLALAVPLATAAPLRTTVPKGWNDVPVPAVRIGSICGIDVIACKAPLGNRFSHKVPKKHAWRPDLAATLRLYSIRAVVDLTLARDQSYCCMSEFGPGICGYFKVPLESRRSGGPGTSELHLAVALLRRACTMSAAPLEERAGTATPSETGSSITDKVQCKAVGCQVFWQHADQCVGAREAQSKASVSASAVGVGAWEAQSMASVPASAAAKQSMPTESSTATARSGRSALCWQPRCISGHARGHVCSIASLRHRLLEADEKHGRKPAVLLHCTHGMHRTALVWCLHKLTQTDRAPLNELAASSTGQKRAAALTAACEASSQRRYQPVPAGPSSSRTPAGDTPRESGVAASDSAPGPRSGQESGASHRRGLEEGRGVPLVTIPAKRKAQDCIEIQSAGPKPEAARKRRRVEDAASDRLLTMREAAMDALKTFQSTRGCRFQWPLESLAETLARAALASNRERGGSF